MICFMFFFKQKTAYEMRISDWSSDVCSSDLQRALAAIDEIEQQADIAGVFRLLREFGARFGQRQAGLVQGAVSALDGENALAGKIAPTQAFGVAAVRLRVGASDGDERRHIAIHQTDHGG